jgi:DnaJ-domain-containing protein 1
MQWYGKALGGLIGFILARQFGAVVGVLMGHVVDEDGGRFVRRTLSWLEGFAHEPDSIDGAYRVLGVAPSASDDEVKIAYRRLMNEHHPDKLAGRGVAESAIASAEQKTREILAAYEKVKSARGFK